MIDRKARNRLAEDIRHPGAGVIKNVEFEERVLSGSAEPASGAVLRGGPWFLYHDMETQSCGPGMSLRQAWL